MLTETVTRVQEMDPVDVSGHEMNVWVDACSLATGVVLKVNEVGCIRQEMLSISI